MKMTKAVFGKHKFVSAAAFDHYLFLGATGSGKTTFLLMLMESVLARQSLPPRSLIYDPKREFLPFVDGMGRLSDAIILNPLDARCSAWDMAKDIFDPIAARELATILTPEEEAKGDNRFFDRAVRDILACVIMTFVKCAPNEGSWRFRDVILACLHPSYLRFVLDQTHDRQGRVLLTNIRVRQVYFEQADKRTSANIVASIQAALATFAPIAAVWEEVCERKDSLWRPNFSLKEWVEDSGDILILGNDESARASIDPLNQALFQRAGELLLNQPTGYVGSGVDQTWVILDEVREAGKLPILSRLLTKARSHGVTLVLSFQDIEGFKAEYGESVAFEIVAQCANKAILKLESPESAKWAVALFGEERGPQETRGRNWSTQGSGSSTNYHNEERTNLVSSQFLFLPKAGLANGIPSFYKHGEQLPYPHEPVVFANTTWKDDIEPYLPKKTDIEPFVPHSNPDIFDLREWTPKDWERLGFAGRPPQLENQQGTPPRT